jgi:hypothetical protein
MASGSASLFFCGFASPKVAEKLNHWADQFGRVAVNSRYFAVREGARAAARDPLGMPGSA